MKLILQGPEDTEKVEVGYVLEENHVTQTMEAGAASVFIELKGEMTSAQAS